MLSPSTLPNPLTMEPHSRKCSPTLPPSDKRLGDFVSISTELSEIAQSGMQEIVDRQMQENQAAIEREARRFWSLVLFGLAMAALSVGISSFYQYRIETRINAPHPAVVNLSLTNTETNPLLCPGDTLQYELTITIDEPSVVDSDSVVRNLDTRRTEILSNTVRNIYEEPGIIVIASNWTLPDMLPATSTRPERPWTAGRHRRLIAITGVEGDNRASVVHVDFIVSAQCPGVRLG